MGDEEIVIGEGPAFERELPKQGSCVARVWRVFNVGLQPGFKGAAAKPNVLVYFILPYKYSKGDFKGKRMLINQKYVAGLGGKSYLRRDAQAIMGRAIEDEEVKKGLGIRKAIEGASCLIQILHENGYANLKAVMSLPDGVPGLPEDPAADPVPDYVPSYVIKLREKAIVQERLDTDKIAEKGWEQADRPAPAPLTEQEEKEALDIF